MKRIVRTTIGIIVLAASLAVLFGEERQASEISVEAGETTARPSWEEITGMRGENVQVFRRSPGSFTMRSYARKKFYFDRNDSTYRAIDLTVRDISALAKLNPFRTHDKYVDAGPYQATWFESAPHDYTFRTDTGRVTFTALFDTAGIDITTECRTDGVKQTLVLRDETAAHDLSWRVGTDNTAVFENHRLIFRDGAGEIAAVMPRLVARDINGMAISIIDTWDGEILRAHIDVPKEAQYPITVDPSMIYEDIDATTGMLDSYSGVDYAGARSDDNCDLYTNIIEAGQYYDVTPTYRCRRSILRYNTPLPNNVTIDSVKVRLQYITDTSTLSNLWLKLVAAHDTVYTSGWYNQLHKLFEGYSTGVCTPTILSDSLDVEAYSVNDTLTFTLNTAGKNEINISGITQLYLVSGRDMGAVTPTSGEFVDFDDDNSYLEIYYTSRTPVSYGSNTAYYTNDGGTYTTARNATTGSTTGTYDVGQQDENPGFTVYRLFYGYDLTDIPTSATCDSVKWKFKGSADHSTTDFLMTIAAANFAGGPAAGWFNDFYGWTSNNAYTGLVSLAPPWNSSGYGTGWVTMTFSAAGEDTVEAAFSDTLRVMAISLEDSTMSEPTGDEYIAIDHTSGNQPSLDVYYTLNPPAAPSGLAATDSTATTVTLSWTDNSDNEDGFFVKDAADTTTAKAVSANDTTTTVTGLSPETGYTFYLVGYNDSGESASSDSVSFSTPYAIPDSLVMTVISPESILVTWNDYSEGACTYLLMNLQDTTVVAGTDSIQGESIGVGGLGPNTFHAWCLKDCLQDTLLAGVCDSAYTHANTPGTTQVFFAGGREFDDSGQGNHGIVHHARVTEGGAADSYGSYEFGTVYGGTAVANGGFETWSDGLPSSWLNTGDVGTAEEATDLFSGQRALRMTGAGALDDSLHRFEQAGIFAAGKWYSVRLAAKQVSGSHDLYLGNQGNTLETFANGGEWVVYEYTGVRGEEGSAPDGIALGAYLDEVWLIDEVSVREMSGSWIDAGNDGSLNPGAGDFTVSVFFSTSGAAGDTMRIAGKADNDNGYELAILPDNTIETWLRKGATTIGAGGTVTVHDSTWHSLSALFDRDDSVCVYLDGAWYGAADISSLAGTITTDSSFTMGTPYYDGKFSGYLDDMRLYTRALTADEAESLVCGGTVGSDSLKLHLAFDLPTTLLKFIIDPNGNPASTKFAVQDSVTGFYLDGTAEPETLRSGALGEWGWGTSAKWGAALGDTLAGIVPDSLIVIRAKARSGD